MPLYVESSFHIIPYLTWMWFESIIFFDLTIISIRFISFDLTIINDCLYFPNNLKDIKYPI